MPDHLQERRADWHDATDAEHLDALTDRQPFICPMWMAYLQRTRPHVLRRSILLHEDMGGFVGAPGRRFLRRGR